MNGMTPLQAMKMRLAVRAVVFGGMTMTGTVAELDQLDPHQVIGACHDIVKAFDCNDLTRSNAYAPNPDIPNIYQSAE